MHTVGGIGDTTPQEMLAVGLGCSAFFLIDFVVSAVSVALEDSAPVLGELRQTAALGALGVFVAIDSLGYLAALVQRAAGLGQPAARRTRLHDPGRDPGLVPWS